MNTAPAGHPAPAPTNSVAALVAGAPNDGQSDAQTILERVKTETGPAYWRSLEELSATPEFQHRMKREFASVETQWIDPVARRTFLKLMGASLAFSGLTACGIRKNREKILPYIRQPEDLVYGKAAFFATAFPLAGYGHPVLVENHEGRPTKIEGNPEHPASLGAALAATQASILGLYDPDRSQTIMKAGEAQSWQMFLDELKVALDDNRANGGAGLRILTETVTSPSVAALMTEVLAAFPKAKWVQYDPINSHGARAAAVAVFGEPVATRYRFENADVVLTLDSDFMVEGPGAVHYAKQFAEKRRVRDPKDNQVRLYAVETGPTNTGSLADHRLPVKPSEIETVARALATALGVASKPSGDANAKHGKFIDTVAKDLKANAGKCLVVAGDRQPAAVHALAHAINAALGNFGKTVQTMESAEARPADQVADLKALAADMTAGAVKALIVLGGNPAYNTSGALGFEKLLKRVPFKVRLGEYYDETSYMCDWHIPETHYLESWGDTRSFDGTVTITQPLVAPLYSSARPVHELLNALLGKAGVTTYESVQAHWKKALGGDDAAFDKTWRRALHDGFVAGTESKAKDLKPKADLAAAFAPAAATAPAGTGVEVTVKLDPTVLDGRFANNGWLQELPKPFTKVTWDNVIHVSPATAAKLGLGERTESQFDKAEEIELKVGDRTVKGPVLRVPGHADDALTVFLGYGRARAGRVASGSGLEVDSADKLGFDAFTIVPTDGTTRVMAAVKATGRKIEIAQTQLHFSLDENGVDKSFPGATDPATQLRNRGIIRSAGLEEYRKNPGFAHEGHHEPKPDESLYAGAWQYKGYAWGMSIDTNVCNGCNACVVACQSENNIPVVGKENVLRQREMHWLRIDQYHTGDPSKPETVKTFHQPLPCMHCENAPCEVVCPVAATVHGDEGTNDMVYNRCVGTRFCSNNCPYKVRRFNWFQYTDFSDPLKKMLNNPDVTVRGRGVMEKCTYCIQRVSYARIEAENDGRKIRDGEVQTACQATCPTDAIVFGNINDPGSRVARLKANTLNYGLLADLNTVPRTTYLAAIKNPNPELKG